MTEGQPVEGVYADQVFEGVVYSVRRRGRNFVVTTEAAPEWVWEWPQRRRRGKRKPTTAAAAADVAAEKFRAEVARSIDDLLYAIDVDFTTVHADGPSGREARCGAALYRAEGWQRCAKTGQLEDVSCPTCIKALWALVSAMPFLRPGERHG